MKMKESWLEVSIGVGQQPNDIRRAREIMRANGLSDDRKFRFDQRTEAERLAAELNKITGLDWSVVEASKLYW